MSAGISRSRAVIAVAVFAVIVAALATVQARPSGAEPVDCAKDTLIYKVNRDCVAEETGVSVSQVVAASPGLVAGTVNGEADDAQANVGYQVASAQSGYGPAGTPGVGGAPISDGVGLWDDSGGDPFADSRACAALATDAGDVQAAAQGTVGTGSAIVKDPVGWAQENIVKKPATTLPPPSSSTRSGSGVQGNPCHDDNKYACFDAAPYAHRDWTDAIYWHWGVYMKWCGYTMGAITSRSYDDHNVLATGFNCTHDYNKDEQRVPVEKISSSHWQQHSNFAFFCKVGGIWKQDHPTEGGHYWSNGYFQEIAKDN